MSGELYYPRPLSTENNTPRLPEKNKFLEFFHKYYLQIFIFLFPVLVSSLTILICYPGSYIADFIKQYLQSFESLQSLYTAQHPVFSTLVFRNLILIYNSLLALYIVHIILFSISAILFSYVLKNFHLRNRYIIFFNVIYSIFPFALQVLITVMKDSIVAFSLLILIAWIILQFQKQKFPWFVVVLMSLFTIFISLQRSLFILFILGLFISALLFLKFDKWKIIVLISISLIGTFSIDAILSHFLYPEQKKASIAEGMSFPIQIDGYILSQEDYHIDKVDADYFFSIHDENTWKKKFTSYNSDPLKTRLRNWGEFSAEDFLWHSLRICWDNKLLCWQGFVSWESNAFEILYSRDLIASGLEKVQLKFIFPGQTLDEMLYNYEHYLKNPDSYISIFCMNYQLDCSNPKTYSDVQTFLSFFQYHEPVNEENNLVFTQSPIKSKTLDQLAYWYLFQFPPNQNPVNPFYIFLFSTLILFLTRTKKNSHEELSANSFIQTPVFLTQSRRTLAFLNFFFYWYFLLCQITVPIFYARYFIAPILLESFILILSMWYYGKWFQVRESLNFNAKITTMERENNDH